MAIKQFLKNSSGQLLMDMEGENETIQYLH